MVEAQMLSSKDRYALWITYVNIVLYALCYQLQRPVEPFLVQSLSKHAEDALVVGRRYGQLQSFFSTVQTIGSPVVGILLDRIGIRKASALVFLASAASYAVLARATDMNLLFLSKIPTALQHAFLVAQAVAATSTAGDETARAQALGRMTTAYTIGATIGPTLGGYLAEQGDLYIGAKLAVVGSLLSVILSLLFLPDVTQKQEDKSRAESSRSFVEDLRRSVEIALRSALWPLLVVKVIGGVASSMFSTALPLVLTQDLEFDPAALGLSMSSSMVAVAIFGAIGMAPLTRFVGASGMACSGLVLRTVLGFITAAIVSAGYSVTVQMQVIAASVFHGLATHALATGLTTQTTGAVSQQEQGALLGLEHGLFSLARIAGPPLGTFLLAIGSFWYVVGACGVLDTASVGILALTVSQTGNTHKSKSS